MTDLATPTQLALFLQQDIGDVDPSALLLLEIASGMVRDHLELHGYSLEAVTGDVALLDPTGAYLFLEGLPVTAVSLVETYDGIGWTTADPATYTVSKRLGVISALPWTGATWPTEPESWRITYDHGFVEVPSSIVGVVLGIAARAYTTTAGIDSERIGNYQVKYAMESAGFTGIEQKALSRYVNPRIA